MFRIRRVFDDVTPADRDAVAQVQKILRERFRDFSESNISGLGTRLRNPFRNRFRSILFVAERRPGRVDGFALLMHGPVERFCFLEVLATKAPTAGRGIGGALYGRVRDEAASLDAYGLFYEVLPDDQSCDDATIRRENAARIRFYERFGARVLVDNEYTLPVEGSDGCMPYLMYDDLDSGTPLGSEHARTVVRAILEREYAQLCPPAYVRRVVRSFRDDPVHVRKPVDRRARPHRHAGVGPRPTESTVSLVVSERHSIHHVHERGYVEAPVRIDAIARELTGEGFVAVRARRFADRYITAVHDASFVKYLKRVCLSVGGGRSVYPYVFPIRNAARPPRELSVRAGYYCIDTFTPLNPAAWHAARHAVDCALTAADQLLTGARMAYALVRPPGHHAERKSFGGFCYLNSSAIAAEYLSAWGRIAMLDLDYHHGNGQQDVFFLRGDVLTVSIHGHPSFAYPYFSGFEDECGEGAGAGCCINYPLPEHVDGQRYAATLSRALKRIGAFAPSFVVVPLGLDPARKDPTGTWTLGAEDFRENGRMVGGLGVPVVVVQEGGYRTRTLGVNARAFFDGLMDGMGRSR